MIAFRHHKNYTDLHLLVEGHEYSSYGSRIKDEAVAFDAIAMTLSIVMNNTHCWVIIILQSFSQVNLIEANGYAGMEDKVHKYLF